MKLFSTLIIGHGYIGSSLSKFIHERNYPIVGVNYNKLDKKELYPVFACDILSDGSLSKLKNKLGNFDPEIIVYCISSKNQKEQRGNIFFNGVNMLFRNFPNSYIIFTSSTSVYGQKKGEIVNEKSDILENGTNIKDLIKAEKYVLKKRGTVLRLSGIFGPNRSIYLERFLNGIFLYNISNKNDLNRNVNQIHRSDVVRAIFHFIKNKKKEYEGEIFNVTDGRSFSKKELQEELFKYFKLNPSFNLSSNDFKNINLINKRPWTSKIVDNSKLINLGWKPKYYSFLDALKKDKDFIKSIYDKIKSL